MGILIGDETDLTTLGKPKSPKTRSSGPGAQRGMARRMNRSPRARGGRK
jgi:hypothetical protein